MAAIMVVIHHFMCAFLPVLIFGVSSVVVQHNRFTDNVRGTPLDIFYAGTFAVAIFFVLSGFVLSIAFFRTHDNATVKKLASRRYFRLILPALAATILCFILISLGVPKLIDSASKLTLSNWLDGTWSFGSNIFQAIYSGSVGILLTGHSPYANVLWTMRIEFFGSFLVFGFLLLLAKSKTRWLGYLVLGIFTFNTWYQGFVIGVLIADCYASGLLSKIAGRSKFTIPLLLGGIFLGAYPYGSVAGTVYSALTFHIAGLKLHYDILYLTIGATMIVLAVLSGKRLQAWFSHPKISGLGKYTYSLYLTHLTVIYTLATAVFVWLHGKIGYTKAVALTMLISAPVICGVTYLFSRYVDQPSTRFAKAFMVAYEKQEIIQITQLKLALLSNKIKRHKNIWRKRTRMLFRPNNPDQEEDQPD